jgi:hypothetical protein
VTIVSWHRAIAKNDTDPAALTRKAVEALGGIRISGSAKRRWSVGRGTELPSSS